MFFISEIKKKKLLHSSCGVQEEPPPLVSDTVPVNGQQIYDAAASLLCPTLCDVK